MKRGHVVGKPRFFLKKNLLPGLSTDVASRYLVCPCTYMRTNLGVGCYVYDSEARCVSDLRSRADEFCERTWSVLHKRLLLSDRRSWCQHAGTYATAVHMNKK